MCVEPEDALACHRACHPQLSFFSLARSWPAGLESLSTETQEFSCFQLPGPGIQLHHHAWHFYNVSSGVRTQVFGLARQPLPTESPPQPQPRFLSRFSFMSCACLHVTGQCGDQRTAVAVGPLLLPRGFWGSNSGPLYLLSHLSPAPPPLYRTLWQTTKLPASLGLEVEPLMSSPPACSHTLGVSSEEWAGVAAFP